METKTKKCVECGVRIEDVVWNYSVERYFVPLCRDCQTKLKEPISKSTAEAIGLYFVLKAAGVPAELEKCDGYKHIDIAVPQAKLNIEVDGIQHSVKPKQAIADLKRTYHSFKKGYFTLRIPNALLHDDEAFEEAVNLIIEIAKVGRKKNTANTARNFSKNPQGNKQMSRILSRLTD